MQSILLQVFTVIILLIYFEPCTAQSPINGQISTKQSPPNKEEHSIIGRNFGHPYIHNHTPDEYNATAQNWCATQDNRGLMYFGNNRGVLEYDGVSWRTIPVANNSIVRSLAIDQNGRIYVGAYSEFGYLEPDVYGNLKYTSLTDKLEENLSDFEDIWSINVNGHDIYFQSAHHLFRLRNDRIDIWEIRNSYHRSFIINEKLYVKQAGIGLTVLVNNKFELVNDGEKFKNFNISAMMPMKDDRILIGSRSNGLFIYDPNYKFDNSENYNFKSSSAISRFETKLDTLLTKNHIYHGLRLTENTFALGTLRAGVIIMKDDGQLIQYFNKNNGLLGDNVLFMHKDLSNSLWVTLGNGISHIEVFSPTGFFDKTANLKEAVYGITTFNDVLFTATNGGVFFLENQESILPKFRKIKGIDNQSWCFLDYEQPNSSVPMDDEQQLLVGSNDGVWKISENKGTFIANLVYKDHFAFKLYQSKRDPSIVFVGLKDGVSMLKYQKGAWLDLGKIDQIQEKILSLTEDKFGNLWIGTNYSGVIKVDRKYFNNAGSSNKQDELVIKYGIDDGLPTKNWNHVYYFNNEVMIATTSGIYTYKQSQNKFISHREISKVLSKNRWVYQMDIDDNGNIWFDSDLGKGALILNEDYSYNLFENQLKIIKPSPENEISVFASCDNVIWFGSTTGLIRFKYDDNIPETIPFNTILRRVSHVGDSILFNGSFSSKSENKVFTSLIQPPEAIINIESNRNTLTFDFSASSYQLESSNQYRYFLEGFDNQWSSWVYETKKDFTNIPSGSYTFHVKAKNIYGQVGKESIYKFSVLTPFYKTWWAQGIYIILGLFVIYGYNRWRTHLLKQEQKALEQTVELRTNELKIKNAELKNKNTEISVQAEELLVLNDKLNSMNEKLEILVNERTFDLEEKNKKLADYAFTNAHELRAPIANILGLINLFDEERSHEEIKEYIVLLKKVAIRLDEITYEIRDKLESEGHSINIYQNHN